MRFINKIVLIAVLMGGSSVAHADDTDMCVAVGRLARAVMSARQAGMPMERIYALTSTPEARHMVVEAYLIPRFKTPEFVQSEKDEFAARFMGMCLRGEL